MSPSVVHPLAYSVLYCRLSKVTNPPPEKASPKGVDLLSLHSASKPVSFALPLEPIKSLIDTAWGDTGVRLEPVDEARAYFNAFTRIDEILKGLTNQVKAISGDRVKIGGNQAISKESLHLFVDDFVHFMGNMITVPKAITQFVISDPGDAESLAELPRARQNLAAIPVLFQDYQKFLESGLIGGEALPIAKAWNFVRTNLESNISSKGINFVVDEGGINLANFKTAQQHALGGAALAACFENLMTNSIKYSPGDSQIRVNLSLEDRSLKFSVEDSGIGIPPEHIAKVLEGERAPNAVLSGLPGTGYGLARVNKIVRELGGRLEIESPVNSFNGQYPGTRITLKIPVQPLKV